MRMLLVMSLYYMCLLLSSVSIGLGVWRSSGGTVPNRRAVLAMLVLTVVCVLVHAYVERFSVVMILCLVTSWMVLRVFLCLIVTAITPIVLLFVLSSLVILFISGLCSPLTGRVFPQCLVS